MTGRSVASETMDSYVDETNDFLRTALLPAMTPFHPHPLIRHGDIQTFLATIRPQHALAVTAGEQPIILDAGVDHTGMAPARAVRLLAYYTPHRHPGRRRGLVMTLHGWEGSSHSTYNLLLGSALIEAGYDVVRLNLRDHGPTHHLNSGLFYAVLLEEVLAATEQVAHMAQGVPFYVVGASLGGNFALRLAVNWNRSAFGNLRRVVAINPVLNPGHTCDQLDRRPLYRNYFRRRWLASLRRKQEAFPELYDFSELAQIPTVRAMTDWLLQRLGSFPDAEDYFSRYAVTSATLRKLSIPATIITARDDPIISVRDFDELPAHPLLTVQIHPSGGHVGFTHLFPLRHWLPQMVLNLLDAELVSPADAN